LQEGSKVFLPVVRRHFPRAFEVQLPAAAAAEADERLRNRLTAAGNAPQIVSYPSKTGARISGKTFRIVSNAVGVAAVRFVFEQDRCVFHLADATGDHTVVCGLGDWIEGHTDVPGADLHHGYAFESAVVVAGARWLDENTLQMTWIFADTAFRDTVVCRFDSDRVTVNRSVNVNSSALSWPRLSGE
jgi:hypothetical protein